MKFYGLKHKKDGVLGVSVSSNEGSDFCNDTTCTLQKFYSGDALYLTPHLSDIKAVLEGVEWYNSSLLRPTKSYLSKDLETFEVDIPI